MSSIKQFYVGVKGVIVNPSLKKALVLSKTDQNNKRFWDIPGGRIDNNERIEETLNRELREEVTNLKDFEVKGLLNAYRLSRDLKDGLGLILLFYKIEATIEDVKLSSEHDGYRWVSINDVDKLNDEDIYMESGYLEAVTRALE